MGPRIQVKLDKYQKCGNIISQTSLLSSYTGSETDADSDSILYKRLCSFFAQLLTYTGGDRLFLCALYLYTDHKFDMHSCMHLLFH